MKEQEWDKVTAKKKEKKKVKIKKHFQLLIL